MMQLTHVFNKPFFLLGGRQTFSNNIYLSSNLLKADCYTLKKRSCIRYTYVHRHIHTLHTKSYRLRLIDKAPQEPTTSSTCGIFCAFSFYFIHTYLRTYIQIVYIRLPIKRSMNLYSTTYHEQNVYQPTTYIIVIQLVCMHPQTPPNSFIPSSITINLNIQILGFINFLCPFCENQVIMGSKMTNLCYK